MSEVITILSVGIGYSLSQLTDVLKNHQRKTMIKKALSNELSIIRKVLSDSLKAGEQRISEDDYPLIVEVYDSAKVELASFLEPDSLSVIQRTYQELRKMNREGHGHVLIPPNSHMFQFTDFKKVIALVDDSIDRLK